MSNNITSLAERREKKRSSGSVRKPFYEEGEPNHFRFVMRLSCGERLCVLYAAMSGIKFFPALPDSPKEVIFIDCPTYGSFAIDGFGLEPLYDLICQDRVIWVRDSDEEEPQIEGQMFIKDIHRILTSDYEIDFYRLEDEREMHLGPSARLCEKPDLS